MAKRTILLILALLGVGAAARWWIGAPKPVEGRFQLDSPQAARRQAERAATIAALEPPPAAVVPAPQLPTPTLPAPRRIPHTVSENIAPTRIITPIQDRTTIDYSLGAPQLKNSAADTDALERALKQIEEATKDAKFESPAPAK